MIGKLEELTLMAVLRAGPKAVPSAIYERVLLGNHSAAFGAVYTTLTRLAAKGLVDETMIEDAASRQRRSFSISGQGRKALAESLDAVAAIDGRSSLGGRHALA